MYGKPKLARGGEAKNPVEAPAEDLAALVELLYAQSGAPVDTLKRAKGAELFDKSCSDCHSLEDGVAGTSAPSLYGLGTIDGWVHRIGNPKAAIYLGADSEMPGFAKELTMSEREELATYLAWLRDANPAEVKALPPLR